MTAQGHVPEEPTAEATEPSASRGVDERLALMHGEAVTQAIQETAKGEDRPLVWQHVPAMTGEDPTYYDRPVIKDPVWKWAVPAYFFTGGAAGAAAVLGAAAQLIDGEGLAGLVKRCRWIAAGGTLAGSALLIYDLGRPERFVNMLRVFRPTSPMNLGSWVLAGSSGLAGASVALGEGGLADAAGLGAGALGVPLAGYTSVLLSNTAVPAWLQIRRSLPGLFYASAISSAASFLEMMQLTEREDAVVRRFGMLGKTAELAASVVVERQAAEVEAVGRALTEGVASSLMMAGKVLTAGSAILSVFAKKRTTRALSGILGATGALAIRFGVFQAGKASSHDPRATFHQQRS